MKTRNLKSHHDWLECLPSNLPNSFEQMDAFEPKRITAVVFEFTDAFRNALLINTEVIEQKSLSLYMGLDELGKISPYFELFLSPEEPVRLSKHNVLTKIIYKPTMGAALNHRGISVNYRNELSLNWGALPYSKMLEAFYAPVQYGDLHYKGRKNHVSLEGPRRVQKFVIPGTDLKALYEVVKTEKVSYLVVHFGLINLNDGQLGVPFNPIIEVIATQRNLRSSEEGDCFEDYMTIMDDQESTTTGLDFAWPCPPLCDPDKTGT